MRLLPQPSWGGLRFCREDSLGGLPPGRSGTASAEPGGDTQGPPGEAVEADPERQGALQASPVQRRTPRPLRGQGLGEASPSQPALKVQAQGRAPAVGEDRGLDGEAPPPGRGDPGGGEKVAVDASFIRAWSRRDPHDNTTGPSDRDARVGRDGKTYGLGYKVHLSVDLNADLPLAVEVASANRNEKRFAPRLLRKTRSLTKGRARLLVADSQYSSRRFRENTSKRGGEAVIPYPSNQRRGEKEALRVDKKFRTHRAGTGEEALPWQDQRGTGLLPAQTPPRHGETPAEGAGQRDRTHPPLHNHHAPRSTLSPKPEQTRGSEIPHKTQVTEN